MNWYSTGTVNVANGSTIVDGVGVTWAEPSVMTSHGFYGPDGKLYEIATVSATQITLNTAYAGATATGQAYVVIPTSGINVELHDKIREFLERVNNEVDTLPAWKNEQEQALSHYLRKNDTDGQGVVRINSTENDFILEASNLGHDYFFWKDASKGELKIGALGMKVVLRSSLTTEGGQEILGNDTILTESNTPNPLNTSTVAYGVGSIILASNETGSNLGQGQTVAASDIKPARISSATGQVDLAFAPLTGTWRALVYCKDAYVTIFQRIA